jgi:hypothetical protein
MNNFTPPYLRFDVPADKLKITALMRAFWIRNASLSSAHVVSAVNQNMVSAETLGSSSTTTSAVGGKRPSKAAPLAVPRSANVRAQATATASTQPQDFGDINAGKTSVQKVAAAITVTPSGNVKLGHNCKMTFTASGPVGSSIWVIYTSNQNQTVYSPFVLVGVINNSSSSTTITFKLDYSVYSLFPGKPFFIVAKDSAGNTIQSDLVTLDPTGVASCNQIHSGSILKFRHRLAARSSESRAAIRQKSGCGATMRRACRKKIFSSLPDSNILKIMALSARQTSR